MFYETPKDYYTDQYGNKPLNTSENNSKYQDKFSFFSRTIKLRIMSAMRKVYKHLWEKDLKMEINHGE